jgi:hypothetical protein
MSDYSEHGYSDSNDSNIDSERYNEHLLITEKETETTVTASSVSTSPSNDIKSPSVQHEKTPLRQAASDSIAAASSNCQQHDSQAQKMVKYRNAQGMKVAIGAVVTISLDKMGFHTDTGVRAVVFDVKAATGAILACCEIGVISQKNGHHFWVPSDRYGVTSASNENAVLTDTLNNIRNLILETTFDPATQQRVTLVQAQKQFKGRSPSKRGSCRCKEGRCTRLCGCKRNGRITCSSSCSCSGNCHILLNK